jgi:hypothetical protein
MHGKRYKPTNENNLFCGFNNRRLTDALFILVFSSVYNCIDNLYFEKKYVSRDNCVEPKYNPYVAMQTVALV